VCSHSQGGLEGRDHETLCKEMAQHLSTWKPILGIVRRITPHDPLHSHHVAHHCLFGHTGPPRANLPLCMLLGVHHKPHDKQRCVIRGMSILLVRAVLMLRLSQGRLSPGPPRELPEPLRLGLHSRPPKSPDSTKSASESSKTTAFAFTTSSASRSRRL
jgi:hypothetical protein